MNSVSRLTLLLVPILLALPNSSRAETIAAEQAAQLLARSSALETKCKFLTSSQHEELNGFVAKAEVAMVAKTSVAQANLIMQKGRAAAKQAACSDAEKADIADILNAARQATSTMRVQSELPKPTTARVAVATSAPSPVAKKNKKTLEPQSKNGALGQYANLTEHYYLARRCNAMSFRAITNLYQNVVSTHHQVVANFGVPAVRAVMQQSESRANATHCG